MANQQGGGRDQGQGQGNWFPWNPPGHQREEDQARQEPGQGQGYQGSGGGGHGQEGQDPRGQDQRGQGQGEQGQVRQELGGQGEDQRGFVAEWVREGLIDFTIDQLRIPLWDNADADERHRQVEQDQEVFECEPNQPTLRARIELILIIPQPYKKFPVRVGVTVGASCVIIDQFPGDFPNEMFNELWGRDQARNRWLKLSHSHIFAIASSNTAITIFFINDRIKWRSNLVLIPQDDSVQEQRDQLAQFGLTLCRWFYERFDQGALVHYNPRSLAAYRWLLDQACDGLERARLTNLLPQYQEEMMCPLYAYDPALYYLYKRSIREARHSLYGHIKYEWKKLLQVVAHRLLTRLDNLYRQAQRSLDTFGSPPVGQFQQQTSINDDFALFRDCLGEYGDFYFADHLLWDDPALNNDDVRPGPVGPTVRTETGNPAEPFQYQRGNHIMNNEIDYMRHDIFERYPVRTYHSVFGRWGYVGRILFLHDRMTVETYVGVPTGRRTDQVPSTRQDIQYRNLLFVRICTVGHSGYSLTLYPHRARWGYEHFECDIQMEISMICQLLLNHIRQTRIVVRWAQGHQRPEQMIGPMIELLFPNDHNRWMEPEYWVVTTDQRAAQVAIRANYLALACRLVNKLAIKLVVSATLNEDDQLVLVANWWDVYWNWRLVILRQTPLQCTLPHLVLRGGLFRVRHRWAYALFDAPNDRA